MKQFGFFQATYDLASMTYQSLNSLSKIYKPEELAIAHICPIRPATALYSFQSMSAPILQEVFRKYQIYPVTSDEALGILRRYLSLTRPSTPDPLRPDRVLPTAEEILGVTTDLPDIEVAKAGRLALERYHLDSSMNFVVSDSLAGVIKALVVVGSMLTNDEITDEQKERVRNLVQNMQEVYGSFDMCLSKSEQYVEDIKATMNAYVSLKKNLFTCQTVEDVWQI